MTEQIIVEFISDTSKLEPGIKQLENLGKVDGASAAEFAKTNEAIKQRAKELKNVTDAEKQTIATFAQIKNSAIGLSDALKKQFLQGIKQALDQQGVGVAELLAKLKEVQKGTVKLGDDMQKQMEAAGMSVDEFTSALETMGNQAKGPVKKQLRELQQQLVELELAGKRNTTEYAEMVKAAGEMKDAVSDAGEAIALSGSDTKNLDKAIEMTGVAASGYSILTGATALLGGENKELEEAMQKLVIVTEIMNGLKQISAALSKREYASVASLFALEKTNIIQKRIDIALTSQSIIVRKLATAAQWALNAAMAANPIGLLLVAVAALAAGIYYLSTKQDEAAKHQNELNDALNAGKLYAESYLEGVNAMYDGEVRRAKEAGASEIELMAIKKRRLDDEKKGLKEALRISTEKMEKVLADENTTSEERENIRKENADLFAQSMAKESEILDHNSEIKIKIHEHETEELKKQIEARSKAYASEMKSYIAFQDAKVLRAEKGSIAEIDAKINAIKANTKQSVDLKINPEITKGEIENAYAQQFSTIRELENQKKIIRLNSLKFIAEAELTATKDGTEAQIKAQKNLLYINAKIEKASLGLSAEQRRAINAKLNDDTTELNRQTIDLRLKNELTGLQLALQATKEGSKEQLGAKMDILYKENELAKNAKDIQNQDKLLLDADYFKKVQGLQQAFSFEETNNAIRIKQAQLQTELNNLQSKATDIHNADLIQKQLDLIDEQTSLDLVANNDKITRGIITNETFEANQSEIISAGEAKRRAIIEDNKEYQIDNELELYNLNKDIEEKKLENILKNTELSKTERIEAVQKLKQIELDRIKAEEAAIEKKYKDGLMSEENYLKAKLKMQAKYSDEEVKQEVSKAEIQKAIRDASIDLLKQGIEAAFEYEAEQRAAALEKQLAQLSASREAELNNKNLTEQQKQDIDRKYKAKEAEIKRKAWLADRDAKLAQAVINGILAVSVALASAPFPLNAVAAAAAGVSAGIQVAKIRSTPIPQFAKGTKNAPEGYAWVGEQGPELRYLNKGDKIYTNTESKKIANAWGTGSTSSADDILANYSMIPTATSQDIQVSKAQSNSTFIDYSKLGKTIAQNVRHQDIPSLVMDENGYHSYLYNQMNRTKINNRRRQL